MARVIFYMDAGGIRPAVLDMAQRRADDSYIVLLPDLFYRFGPTARSCPRKFLLATCAPSWGP